MRNSLLVRTLALLAGSALTAASVMPARAAGDVLEQAACVARSGGPPNVTLGTGPGADRYDFAWMADREHFAGPSRRRAPYVIRLADPESPRSLVEHDRVILPGLPRDWTAARRGADLVLCARRVPAVIVIDRHFCSGPVSAGGVANGEIEEITFLGGVSWLADDLKAQIEGGTLPAELAEDLRGDVAMALPARHARDPDMPHVIAYAPEVEARVAGWRIEAMSRALGEPAGSGCSVRQADLRERIIPVNRSNR